MLGGVNCAAVTELEESVKGTTHKLPLHQVTSAQRKHPLVVPYWVQTLPYSLWKPTAINKK